MPSQGGVVRPSGQDAGWSAYICLDPFIVVLLCEETGELAHWRSGGGAGEGSHPAIGYIKIYNSRSENRSTRYHPERHGGLSNNIEGDKVTPPSPTQQRCLNTTTQTQHSHYTPSIWSCLVSFYYHCSSEEDSVSGTPQNQHIPID